VPACAFVSNNNCNIVLNLGKLIWQVIADVCQFCVVTAPLGTRVTTEVTKLGIQKLVLSCMVGHGQRFSIGRKPLALTGLGLFFGARDILLFRYVYRNLTWETCRNVA